MVDCMKRGCGIEFGCGVRHKGHIFCGSNQNYLKSYDITHLMDDVISTPHKLAEHNLMTIRT